MNLEITVYIDTETGRNMYLAHANTQYGYIEGKSESLSDAIAEFNRKCDEAEKTDKSA